MRSTKKGFTLIEVMLFLVLTSALFVAVAVGTHNSIFQQRYNDSVQNFVEFLRGIYSQVSNVENQGQGRSGKAIYGKLITFGEGYDLAEKQIQERNAIFTYDVIGNVGDIGTGDAIDALSTLDANVIFYDENTSEFYSAGMAASYTPRWGARIEKPSGHTDFTGSIMIVRHPRSGTVFTYYSEEIIPVNSMKHDQNSAIRTAVNETQKQEAQSAQVNPLKGKINTFKIVDVDFCVNPYGSDEGRLRRNIRLVKGARNASGIILPDTEGGDDRCKK